MLGSCQPGQRLEPLTLVVGSWYGFYPFYYALEHNMDKQYGVRLKILEPTNISNLRRSYLRDQVDMAATSMLEFVNSVTLSKQSLRPIIITDYSNGGDVIIASKAFDNVEDLKGQRIAVPSKGIGEYILSLVFNDPVPGTYFKQHKIPETECEEAFNNGLIDACVTYPPISTYLLKNPDLHAVYSTKSHPGRVFDVVWTKPGVSNETIGKVLQIWFSAIDKIKQDPDAFHHFVARITNVSSSSVKQAMQGIQLVDRQAHQELLSNPTALALDMVQACKVAQAANCAQFTHAFDRSQ